LSHRETFLNGPVPVEAIDKQILGELSENGRMSYAELGRKVGLGPHAVAERVRRLLHTGIITGFTATVNPAALGRALEAIIDVRLLPSTSPEDFEQEVGKLDAVRDLVFVTGRFDYQLRVACRDPRHLDQTVRAIRQRAGAALTETRIVMHTRSGSGSDAQVWAASSTAARDKRAAADRAPPQADADRGAPG
jgi:Lrp/AsnC family transcriptional regulator, leucine-responsive regulatory protein